jgi:hypothetical protein
MIPHGKHEAPASQYFQDIERFIFLLDDSDGESLFRPRFAWNGNRAGQLQLSALSLNLS